MKYARILALVGLAWLTTGCLLAGNYHSAKTLPKGQSSVGMTFSATSYARNGEDGRITIPNILPEVTYSVALQDNLEIGGRVGVGSLALEGNVKYRFLQSPQLHMAIVPTVGAQSLILINGFMVKLPVVATVDLADNVAINLSGFGTTTSYSSAGADDSDDDLAVFSGSLGGFGGSIGLEFSGATFAIRPGIEVTRYQLDFGDDDDTFDGFNTINVMVHLSFIRGREKQQLDRIEQKLDDLSNPGPGN